MSFNQITLVGNIGRDAELKRTKDGVPVTDFSIAVSKNIGPRNPDGTRNEKTIWFKVIVWRERAESLHPYLKKGTKVLVTGELDYSTYVDKEGKTQVTLEVSLDKLDFLSSKDDSQRASMGSGSANSGNYPSSEESYAPVVQAASPQRGNTGRPATSTKPAATDDDIPF
jgi:single-strand DNA-binding protein